jgi:hypothetical protein
MKTRDSENRAKFQPEEKADWFYGKISLNNDLRGNVHACTI